MNLHLLGEASLTLSTCIYFVWFIPQLTLSFKRRSTEGLSLWMHSFLVMGYMADLLYGFGRHMPIQYRLVTLVGLVALSIEHFQFGRYGLRHLREKITYILLTLFFISLLFFAIYNLTLTTHNKFYYDMAGVISFGCWFVFAWPQIIKNHKSHSTEGLSSVFILLAVVSGICDVISTFALGWDWPSRIGAPVGLFQKAILLGQCYYYKKSHCDNNIRNIRNSKKDGFTLGVTSHENSYKS